MLRDSSEQVARVPPTAEARELSPPIEADGDAVQSLGSFRGARHFSRREADCLALLVRGLTDAEIATELKIKHATVRFHLDGARRKVSARSRTHLAALVVAWGVAAP